MQAWDAKRDYFLKTAFLALHGIMVVRFHIMKRNGTRIYWIKLGIRDFFDLIGYTHFGLENKFLTNIKRKNRFKKNTK